MHVAQGVPRAWGIGDLESFLQSQAWSEISDLVRKRNSWIFRAKAPKDNATTASWHYDIGSSDSTDWTITIQVAVRAPQAPQKNVSLRGPRREVTLKEFWPAAKVSDPEEFPQAKSPTDSQKPAGVSPSATEGVRSSARDRSQRSRSPKRSDEVAPTIPDTQEDESKEDENMEKTEESRPPKKQRLVEPSDPQEALSSFGWQQWDQYGNGDCFFRHASVFVNKANTQPAVQDSQHHAAWIRAQTCQHIKKHSRRYAELFSGKSAFDAWLTNAAKPTSWADGRTIQAASEKLGCPVVIWNKDGNTYTRYVIAPKFSRGFACGSTGCNPICLLLTSKHYTALVPPPTGSVPHSWLRETPDVVIDLSGGVGGVASGSAGLASVGPSPPSVRAGGSPSQRTSSSAGTPSVHSLASPAPSVAQGSAGRVGGLLGFCAASSSRSPSVHSLVRSAASVRSGVSGAVPSVALPPVTPVPARSSCPSVPTPSVRSVAPVRRLRSKTFCADAFESRSCPSSGHRCVSAAGPVSGPVTPSVHSVVDPACRRPARASSFSSPSLGPPPESDSSHCSVDKGGGSRNCTRKIKCLSPEEIAAIPTVDLPADIKKWWTCDICGYQIFRHVEDKPEIHRTRRKHHLRKKHGISCNNVPEIVADPAPVGSAIPPCEKFAQVLCEVLNSEKWPGLHQVNRPVKRKGARNLDWPCEACGRVCRQAQLGSQICKSSDGDKVPQESVRQKLLKKCQKKARQILQQKSQERTKQLKDIHFRQEQQRFVHAKQVTPAPLFQGLPVFPAGNRDGTVWWSCSFCDFKVIHGEQRQKASKRIYHLTSVHGIKSKDIPKLPKTGFRPTGVLATIDTVQKRWVRQLELFKKVRWAAAHDLSPEPTAVYQTRHSKNGKRYTSKKFTCLKCSCFTRSSEIPAAICSAAQKGRLPSLAKRKALWQKCREEAAKEITMDFCQQDNQSNKRKLGSDSGNSFPNKRMVPSFSKKADGSAATGRGLRAVRVGEAKHPGPSGDHGGKLRCVAWNINSFRNHFAAMCQEAEAVNANVIFLQETGITRGQMVSAMHLARRHGWQLSGTPAGAVADGGRGGTAILVKEPLALADIHSTTETWGQLQVAEILGHKVPITAINGYRRPQQALDAPNEALMESFCRNQHKHWVFACDWNLDPASDPLASVMTSFCGQLGSSSGHKRSTHPTDSVWFSQSLSCEKQSPMDALSDHFGSFVELGQIPCLDPSPPAWIFKSVARFQDNCDLPSADEAAQAWHHVSTPS